LPFTVVPAAYDIFTKQHGGTIAVDSKIGDHTEFTITLPRTMFAGDGGRA
jgi:signal transduction histidine kinase